MSEKCPHCGSYNTESKTIGKVAYVGVQAARVGAASAAAVAGRLIGQPATGTGGAIMIWRGSKDWGNDICRHHCCECGKDFK